MRTISQLGLFLLGLGLSACALLPAPEVTTPFAWATAARDTPNPPATLALPTAPPTTSTAHAPTEPTLLRYVTALGLRNAPGQLHLASAVGVNAQGEILVADAGNQRLQWFSPAGELLKTAPLIDSYPVDLAPLPGDQWAIADLVNNEIEIRTNTGELLRTLSGWPLPEDTAFASARIRHVVPDPTGGFYLAEDQGARVVALNSDGSLREIWYCPAAQPLDDVADLQIDTAGNLYIACDWQNRVFKRAPTGEVQEIAIEPPIEAYSHLALLPEGAFYVAQGDWVRRYDATGQLLHQWQNPGALAQDLASAPDGSVVALYDTFFSAPPNIVVRYAPDGQLVAGMGTVELQLGQFDSHADFSVSSQGDVWVVDMGAPFSSGAVPRLVHLDAQGQHLNTLAVLATNIFTCHQYAVAAMADQSVYVGVPCADTLLHISATGEVLNHWEQLGGADGQFETVTQLVLAPDGQSLYLLDAGKQRVLQMGLAGELLAEWNSEQLGIKAPIGLAVEPSGNFFLLDAATNQVVVRSPEGTLLTWPLPNPQDSFLSLAVDAARRRIYVGVWEGRLYVFDWAGNALGQYALSWEKLILVEVGPEGQVYSSSGGDKIMVFVPED